MLPWFEALTSPLRLHPNRSHNDTWRSFVVTLAPPFRSQVTTARVQEHLYRVNQHLLM